MSTSIYPTSGTSGTKVIVSIPCSKIKSNEVIVFVGSQTVPFDIVNSGSISIIIPPLALKDKGVRKGKDAKYATRTIDIVVVVIGSNYRVGSASFLLYPRCSTHYHSARGQSGTASKLAGAREPGSEIKGTLTVAPTAGITPTGNVILTLNPPLSIADQKDIVDRKDSVGVTIDNIPATVQSWDGKTIVATVSARNCVRSSASIIVSATVTTAATTTGTIATDKVGDERGGKAPSLYSGRVAIVSPILSALSKAVVGQPLTIIGSGFTPQSVVFTSDDISLPVRYIDSTRLITTRGLPPNVSFGSKGTCNIIVRNGDFANSFEMLLT